MATAYHYARAKSIYFEEKSDISPIGLNKFLNKY
jgi:hypothetical protein